MKTNILTTALLAAISCPAFAVVTIDWVTIGDPGNAAQSAANRTHSESEGDGYGAVSYTYKISRNETTITQYAAFLNAVAAADTYGLYRTSMAEGYAPSISRTGISGSYTYSVIGSGDRPITWISWYDAARFANWIHNGHPTGAQNTATTEDGAYTLTGNTGIITKNVGATVWIPTENEWFKAAYYDPTHMGGTGGYWLYANQSDSITSNIVGVPGAANFRNGNDFAVTQNNQLIYGNNYLTEVGAYGIDSQSYYGINDMGGNVKEWNDAIIERIIGGEPTIFRGVRGGSWDLGEFNLRSSTRIFGSDGLPSGDDNAFGFRLASIPEPSSTLLSLLFSTGLLCRRKRND